MREVGTLAATANPTRRDESIDTLVSKCFVEIGTVGFLASAAAVAAAAASETGVQTESIRDYGVVRFLAKSSLRNPDSWLRRHSLRPLSIA